MRCEEVLFAKFELRLWLALINKEAVFVKLELRLRLVLANLRQRPRLWLELRLRLALTYKLSAAYLSYLPLISSFGGSSGYLPVKQPSHIESPSTICLSLSIDK